MMRGHTSSRSYMLTVILLIAACAVAGVAADFCSSNYHSCDSCTRAATCQWCEGYSSCSNLGNYCPRGSDYYPNECPSSRLAAGAIVGAVFGSLFFVCCIFGIVMCMRRRRMGYWAQPQPAVMISASPGFVVQQPAYGAQGAGPQPVYDVNGQPMYQNGQPQYAPANYGQQPGPIMYAQPVQGSPQYAQPAYAPQGAYPPQPAYAPQGAYAQQAYPQQQQQQQQPGAYPPMQQQQQQPQHTQEGSPQHFAGQPQRM